MSEFERECEEYECPPITTQWDNVVDMLLAQSEPKNHKKEKKIWENKWSQICIEKGWGGACERERERKGAPLCVRVCVRASECVSECVWE